MCGALDHRSSLWAATAISSHQKSKQSATTQEPPLPKNGSIWCIWPPSPHPTPLPTTDPNSHFPHRLSDCTVTADSFTTFKSRLAGRCSIPHPPSSALCPFQGGQCQSATGPLVDYLSRQKTRSLFSPHRSIHSYSKVCTCYPRCAICKHPFPDAHFGCVPGISIPGTAIHTLYTSPSFSHPT